MTTAIARGQKYQVKIFKGYLCLWGFYGLPLRWDELSNATGRLVGLSVDWEFGILKPPSVGEGVDALESTRGASSWGGLGLSELAPVVPPEG